MSVFGVLFQRLILDCVRQVVIFADITGEADGLDFPRFELNSSESLHAVRLTSGGFGNLATQMEMFVAVQIRMDFRTGQPTFTGSEALWCLAQLRHGTSVFDYFCASRPVRLFVFKPACLKS